MNASQTSLSARRLLVEGHELVQDPLGGPAPIGHRLQGLDAARARSPTSCMAKRRSSDWVANQWRGEPMDRLGALVALRDRDRRHQPGPDPAPPARGGWPAWLEIVAGVGSTAAVAALVTLVYRLARA